MSLDFTASDGRKHPVDLTILADDIDLLARRLNAPAVDELTRIAHGRTPADWVRALRNAVDPVAINAAAELLAANENGCACSGDEPPEPSATQREEAAARLLAEAIAPFLNNGELRAKLSTLGIDWGNQT